jgi:YidC/Oxa1 family membrane protein insertase
MDMRTLFLYAAFAVVSFNIWTDWRTEHPSAQMQHIVTNQSISTTNFENNPPVSVNESPKTKNENPNELIKVKTDVLDIKINMDTGDIVNSSLLKFPSTSAADSLPFELFKQDLTQNYYASSQFVSLVNNHPENLNIRYFSSQRRYELMANQNDLKVVLRGKNSEGLQITKTYSFQRGSYIIDVHYNLENNSDLELKTYLNQQLVWQNPKIPETSMFKIGSYTGGSFGEPGKHRYKKISFDDMKKQNLDVDTNGGWIAMQQHYFLTAWVPNQKGLNRLYTQSSNNKYTIGAVSEQYKIEPQHQLTLNSQLYVGPEDTAILKTLAPGLDLTVDYGWLWFLSNALFGIMKTIESFVGNWGWSIIFITVLIKLMFYRLSASSYRSMANMRRLQPKLEQLKQRFGDDKAKFSQATMELYRQEKVNPLGGCLPILIQIPVFIALYWVLVESVELRHAPFLLWIHDLSAADPCHVLPLIMGGTLFIQQKLNPTPPDPTQAKLMMMMPIFMTFLFWGFPAGLVLYWIVNNSLSILQQWWITKRFKDAPLVTTN